MPPADPASPPRTVLFRRRFKKLRGGHIKVRDYIDHVAAHPGFRARLWLTPDSKRDDPLWRGLDDVIVERWDPAEADILALAGLDWRSLTPDQRAAPPCPVLNLVQHTRHADPAEERYGFLGHPATRVCCSPQVEEAIRATGRVNGEVMTIPYGIDPALWGYESRERDVDVVVCGSKRPAMAAEIGATLRKAGHTVVVLDGIVPRVEFLDTLARGRVAVFLPNDGEGFYLPALESMAMGIPVVCPALGGLQSFLVDGENALTPPCEAAPLADAARGVLAHSDADRRARLAAAAEVARRHSPEAERRAVHGLLESMVGQR